MYIMLVVCSVVKKKKKILVIDINKTKIKTRYERIIDDVRCLLVRSPNTLYYRVSYQCHHVNIIITCTRVVFCVYTKRYNSGNFV